MRKDCKSVWEGLVELAEGRQNQAAQTHLQSCPDCVKALSELRRVIDSGAVAWHQAPEEAIAKAIRLMPRRASRSAIFVSTSFATAHARSGGSTAHITFEVDRTPIRLMVSPNEAGWKVVGQLPLGWSIDSDSVSNDDEGRFLMQLEDLLSPITIAAEDEDLLIPPLAEFINANR